MAVNETEAKNYIDSSKPDVASLLAVAKVMITDYVGSAPVPEVILDNAIMVLVQELALRQRSPGGVTPSSGDIPARVSSDPMKAVYPLLRPWVAGLA